MAVNEMQNVANSLVTERESLIQTLQQNVNTIEDLRDDLIRAHDNEDAVMDVSMSEQEDGSVQATIETDQLVSQVTTMMNESPYSSVVEGTEGNYTVTIMVGNTGGEAEQL